MASPTEAPSLWRRIRLTLGMIRFSHSIFALPFALLSAFLAAGGWPARWTLGWIVVACVFARSAAMAFNRLHDERFDRQNPRTRHWALPAGLLSRRFVWCFLVFCAAGFVFSAAMLNPLAFILSPAALAILLGYSTAKRWTAGSHFILGLALGIAPIGAWIGVRGEWGWPPLLLGLGVLFWVAGFDMIYSCQDEAFDRRVGLRSLPARVGRARALALSALSHALALACFLLLTGLPGLGWGYLLALCVAAALLVYEQSIVSPADLSRLNMAFFTLNGWVSLLVFLGGFCDLVLLGPGPIG